MEDDVPLTKQLIDRYEETGESTLAVMKVPHDQVSEYGVIDPAAEASKGLFRVKTFVEKPKPEDAPYFDSNPELENNLRDKGKDELLKIVQETTDINMYFIRQSHPKGLGDAVLTAKAFIGDEPFVVLLGDDLKPVRKAIIPAAGLGTRFLPATKALAKEMLPIVDTPTIEYIVREAIASGIEEIVIVDGKSKRSIEDHTTKAVYDFAQTYQVDMPITTAIYQVLYEDKPLAQAIADLMARPLKSED
ncbi:hypothetical protein GQS40_07400|uniref:UTP--glucose-1-phosphate uridylyltransferase n=1 Tax=Leuconostoc lactis TaxID=1246 RepID=A0A6L7AAE3_LEULA|nr:hypothetical protein [Leuconostoc lactis]